MRLMNCARFASTILLSIAATSFVTAQDESAGGGSPPGFEAAAFSVELQLHESLGELSQVRSERAVEQVPLSRRLRSLQAELQSVREEYKVARRALDQNAVDVTRLSTSIKNARANSTYLRGLLGDYARNFESRLHIAESQRYEQVIEAAKLAPENTSLSDAEVVEKQLALLQTSVDRLEDVLGGTRFEGKAVVEDGRVLSGTFAMLGPAVLFRSDDGQAVGTAEQRIGSLQPTVFEFSDPEVAEAAAEIVSSGWGRFPFDPTLGEARQVEESHITLLDEVKKGGPVMIPIGVMAGVALLVALGKWVSLALLRKPARGELKRLLEAVREKDVEAANGIAENLSGPVGEMLRGGVAHLREPRALIEEVMYETMLKAKLKLNRALPFIAICAASAPLLGLLGTVQGIINTFKLITIFGSGDVKTLSGGISEALITTKFGLIVAIPSLLLHAFLARKARRVTGEMESAAIALLNETGRAHYEEPLPATAEAVEPDVLRSKIEEVMGELLSPMVSERLRHELATQSGQSGDPA